MFFAVKTKSVDKRLDRSRSAFRTLSISGRKVVIIYIRCLHLSFRTNIQACLSLIEFNHHIFYGYIHSD